MSLKFGNILYLASSDLKKNCVFAKKMPKRTYSYALWVKSRIYYTQWKLLVFRFHIHSFLF